MPLPGVMQGEGIIDRAFLIRKTDTAGKVKPDYLFYLGDAATKLKNLPEAEEAFAKYLQTAKDPAGKAKVLLTLGAVKISAHKPDEAQKIAEEIIVLQPEGRVNAEARLLAGEVQLERGHFIGGAVNQGIREPHGHRFRQCLDGILI